MAQKISNTQLAHHRSTYHKTRWVRFFLFIVGVTIYLSVMVWFARRVDAQSAATKQQTKQLVRVRNFVIPQEVIDSFKMRPVDEKTFGQWVVGEDDRVYGLDETLRVLFVMSREHWRANDLKRELAAPTRK